MKTKTQKYLILLICIFIVSSFFAYLYFVLNINNTNDYKENIKNQSSNINTDEIIKSDNKEEEVINYYTRSCLLPRIEVLKDGVWEKAGKLLLPGKGQYILDGKYIPYTLCDYVRCEPFSKVIAPKYDYEFIGIEDVSHIQKRFDNTEAPSYISKKFEGRIRVTSTVYTDNMCKNKIILKNYFDF